MLPTSVDLLDASVWVPLSAPDHVHHKRAREYWISESAESVAFCRVTSLALLRCLTNAHIMKHAVQTAGAAWDAYRAWLELPEIVFMNEPDGTDLYLGRFVSGQSIGAASWTDAYIAAFAAAADCRLVTFDGGMSRYAGVRLLHLAN